MKGLKISLAVLFFSFILSASGSKPAVTTDPELVVTGKIEKKQLVAGDEKSGRKKIRIITLKVGKVLKGKLEAETIYVITLAEIPADKFPKNKVLKFQLKKRNLTEDEEQMVACVSGKCESYELADERVLPEEVK